jgi:hypothetical protein
VNTLEVGRPQGTALPASILLEDIEAEECDHLLYAIESAGCGSNTMGYSKRRDFGSNKLFKVEVFSWVQRP